MNELKVMAGALRKELDRRKAAEDELRVANERLQALSQPTVAAPEPPPPVVEKEIETVQLPARLWKSLDGMTPAELLVAHATDHHSGTLILTSGEQEKQLFFEKGKVFSVASNNPKKFLTQQLIELGYITEEQRQRALEIKQETHLALGRILLILGAINEEQLIEVMRTKMEDEIADVFDWKDAQYAFVEGEVPSLQLVPLRIEVAPLVVKRLNSVLSPESEVPSVEEPPIRDAAPDIQHFLVASPKSKKFHKETCNSVKRIPPEARTLFATPAEARDAGYEACRTCFR